MKKNPPMSFSLGTNQTNGFFVKGGRQLLLADVDKKIPFITES